MLRNFALGFWSVWKPIFTLRGFNIFMLAVMVAYTTGSFIGGHTFNVICGVAASAIYILNLCILRND